MTVARMKSAQSGFDEVGKAYVWKALVGAVAFGLVATAYAMPIAAQQSATPPGAATIEWQRVAANRPYDEARKTILAQVRKTAWQGPMQPEWQNLTADSTPERYRDAKFGIFIAESDRGDLTGDRQARAFQAAARWPLDLPAQPAGVHAYAYRIGLDARGKDGRTAKDDIASGWCGEKSMKPSCSFVMGRKA
jgi:hypothetical protein